MKSRLLFGLQILALAESRNSLRGRLLEESTVVSQYGFDLSFALTKVEAATAEEFRDPGSQVDASGAVGSFCKAVSIQVSLACHGLTQRSICNRLVENRCRRLLKDRST